MEKIDSIISQVFEIKPLEIKDEMSMDNLASWDSLRNMELIATLEREFSFELSFDEITEMVSVGKIREMVLKKIQ